MAQHEDPYEFRNAIVSEDALVQLRQRKQGKLLEAYQRRQNEVDRVNPSLPGRHLICLS